jgi:hypothetical protein
MPAVEHSMWRHLLSLRGPGADGAWIRFAGISRSLFFELCTIARLHDGFHPRMDEDGAPLPREGAGAPLKMGDDDAMGLALRYVFGQSETVGLMCCFFVSSESINKKLDRGLEILDWALRRHPDAKIRWPSFEEQLRDARIIAEHGPDTLPKGICNKTIFFWVDGMAMRVAPGSNKEVERSMCGTKHKGPHVSCIFAFSPSGVIIWQNINLPGAINDTEGAEPLVKLVLDPSKTIAGGAGLGDAAFRGTESGATECFVGPSTAYHCTTVEHVGHALALACWTLRHRQSVEWAIRTLRRTFRRLAVDMHSDEKKRGRILSVCTRLHNLRVRNGARTQLGATSTATRLIMKLLRSGDAPACSGSDQFMASEGRPPDRNRRTGGGLAVAGRLPERRPPAPAALMRSCRAARAAKPHKVASTGTAAMLSATAWPLRPATAPRYGAFEYFQTAKE